MADKQDHVVYSYSANGQQQRDVEGAMPPSTTAGMPDSAASGASTAESEPESSDPGQIRENIEVTRANMSQTIDEIQNRLSPAAVKQQAVDRAKAAAQQAKDTTMQKATQLTNQAKDTAAQKAAQLSESAGPAVQQARAKVQQGVATAQEKIQNNASPRMLGIFAAVLAGLAVLFLLGRRRNNQEEEEADDEGVMQVVELATGRVFRLVPTGDDDE